MKAPSRTSLVLLALLTLLGFLTLLPPRVVYSQPSSSPAGDVLWIATSSGILKVSVADGSHLLKIPDTQDVRTLAVDERRGVLWTYDAGTLRAYDFTGELSLSVPVTLPDMGSGIQNALLSVNPTNGAIWLGWGTHLSHFDSQGRLLQTIPLPDPVRALAIDRTRSYLWVGTAAAVSAFDATGTQVVILDLGEDPVVKDLDVDVGSGDIWIALANTLGRYDAFGARLLEIPIDDLRRVAGDGQRGIWAATFKTLLRLDASGQVAVNVSKKDPIIALIANPDDQSAWMASLTELWYLSTAGEVLLQLKVQGRIWDLVLARINRPPDAVDDTATTTEGIPVTIAVLANDSDPDGDPLMVESVTHGVNGAVLINVDNTVTYTPVPGLIGTDTFTCTISDGRGETDTASVTVTVQSKPNRPPDAVDDSMTALEDTLVTIPVLTNDTDPDGDPLTVLSVTQPANGAVVINPDGTVTYTPNAGFSGQDNFTYTISDGRAGTDTATVGVTVNPAPPTITGFTPTSGQVGDSLTIAGTNFRNVRSVSFNGIRAVITGGTRTTIQTFVPLGATTGRITVETPGGSATSTEDFIALLGQDFALSISPPAGTVVQGTSTVYMVQLTSTGSEPFTGLAGLTVTGLPAGATASFSPTSLAGGQTATLRINMSSATPVDRVSFTINGAGSIDGRPVTRSAAASLEVLGAGITALTGRVLDTDAQPIRGVTLSIVTDSGRVEAVTDESGNFLMENPPIGDQLLFIDGQTASTSVKKYPTIPINVTIVAGVVNQIPFIPHLHLQKNFNFTPIKPTEETIATDPEMPDVALRIPAGTQIIGWDGLPNDKVSIRTVPIDRLPVMPPPPEVRARTVYMFYFGKRGGGVASRPIPFVAPNDLGLAPGEKAELWYFDESPNPGEAPNDWRIAGTGTVSADGKTIVTDPGVGIPRFCCGAAAWNDQRTRPQQPGETPQQGQGAPGGDPVDLSTGIFMMTATDMVLPGKIPVTMTRSYRSGESTPGPFGIGTTMSYDDFLQQTSTGIFTYVYRGNARAQFFRQPDSSFANSAVPAFRGARITVGSDGNRTLRFKDGTALVFDARGLPIRVRDRNLNEVVIKREVETNPTMIIEPSGKALNINWVILARDRATSVTDPLGRTVRYEYDGQNRLVAVTNPEGGITRYTYDDQHRMTSITDPRGITFLRNTYDVNSRVCEQEQADSGKFRFYYITADQAALPESLQLLEEATAGGPISMPPCSAQPSRGIVVATVAVDPMGHPTTHRFNASGYVTSATNALGQATFMEREADTNLPLSTTDPLGRTTRFTYDEFGNVTSITDSAGNVRVFEYELTFNRLTKLTDPLGKITSFAYNNRGSLASITDPLRNVTRIAYNEYGQPISTTDSLGNVTRFKYDAAGNLASIVDPLGNKTQRAYDLVSRLIEQSDPRGRTTRFGYDVLNRIKQIEDAITGLTAFTYDGNGNLLTVTDARGSVTSHTYDSMDRLASRIDPVGAAESFEYDRAGNLIRHTDRKGQANTFSYDALDRRMGASYADGATTSFAYDAAGRLVQAEDSIGGKILNEYDTLNRLVTQITGLGMIRYEYDALNRRRQMVVSGQDPVSYDYDVNSRLTKITQGGQVVDLTYDALGRRALLTLPNGVSTEYRYDAASRLTELIYRSAMGTLGNLTYQYDAAGNRTQVDGSFARTLLPDPVASATYDAANRQRSFGDKTMDFDPNGNLTSITDPSGVTTYTWDARNRLAALTGLGTIASFTYDPLGRRVAKEINGNSTQYLYDGLDVVQELSNGTSVSYLRGLSIDEPFVRNKTEFYLADVLGSVVGIADLAGLVQTEYTYAPFGRSVVAGAPTGNSFQYAGRENDGAGLYYYRARYLSTDQLRFITEDPIGITGGLNTFAYVGNRPTNFIDPLGLSKDTTEFDWWKAYWEAYWDEIYRKLTERTLEVQLLDALPFHIPSLIEEMLNQETIAKQWGVFLKRIAPDVILNQLSRTNGILDRWHKFNQGRRLPNALSEMIKHDNRLLQQGKSIKNFRDFLDFFEVWDLYDHYFNRQ